MDEQRDMFCDHRIPAAAKPRLKGQCKAILERLMQGPATNDELSRIARKYTGRISDLRKMEHDIRVTDHDVATGLVTYKLFPKAE